MFTHVQTFFNALLGVTIPEVAYIILALALTYIVLRSFLSIFHINTRILDFAMYVIIGYIALANLGGLVWNFSFS